MHLSRSIIHYRLVNLFFMRMMIVQIEYHPQKNLFLILYIFSSSMNMIQNTGTDFYSQKCIHFLHGSLFFEHISCILLFTIFFQLVSINHNQKFSFAFLLRPWNLSQAKDTILFSFVFSINLFYMIV